jgi:polysaccharide export outer membrane protein
MRKAGNDVALRRKGAKKKVSTLIKSCVLLSLLLSCVHAVVAQEAQPPATQTASTATPPTLDERYRIGPGDVLDIRVYNRPQLSREAVRVDERGQIRMPLIDGEIQAACRTESELADDIYSRYQKYYRLPHVDVFIKEYNSTPVAVIGAVTQPGRFQLQRRVRLLELVSLAGGPTTRAGARLQIAHTAAIFRCDAPVPALETMEAASNDDTAKRFEFFDLKDTLEGGARANPYVQPGDIITVPEAEQAYVVGNVLRPAIIPLKERVTVMRAIAMAGGTMPDTKKDKVRIVRQLPGSSEQTEIAVNLQDINDHKAEDIPLQANDIVEVPTASGKRFLRSLLGSVIPAVSQLPVQVVH